MTTNDPVIAGWQDQNPLYRQIIPPNFQKKIGFLDPEILNSDSPGELYDEREDRYAKYHASIQDLLSFLRAQLSRVDPKDATLVAWREGMEKLLEKVEGLREEVMEIRIIVWDAFLASFRY